MKNKYAIYQEVNNFIKYTYPRLLSKSKLSNLNPISPTFNTDKVQTSVIENKTENKVIEYVSAKQIIDHIAQVVNVMTNNQTQHQTIMKLNLQAIDDFYIYEQLNMSRATYYRNKQESYLEFADLIGDVEQLYQ